MPSGGARARSGPPPDPNALRRDRDKAAWTHLPSAGRQGDLPAWPLTGQSKREAGLWEAEWRRPQAIMWEAAGQQLEVALFVRAVVVAEGRKATSSDRTVVLRFLEGLGISQAGLARNRWVIDDSQPTTKVMTTDDPDRTGAKARFRSIEGGAAS